MPPPERSPCTEVLHVGPVVSTAWVRGKGADWVCQACKGAVR